ncbi:MAG: DUF4328 domain-containing protein, partial [Myxococcota bacterium]
TDAAETEKWLRMQTLTQVADGLLNIACLLVFLMWIYRATVGVRALGQQTMNGPRLAVVSFLIPIANCVWGPVHAVSVVRGMATAAQRKRPPVLVIMWWLAMAGASVLGVGAAFVMSIQGIAGDAYTITLMSKATLAVAGVLTVAWMYEVGMDQRRALAILDTM